MSLGEESLPWERDSSAVEAYRLEASSAVVSLRAFAEGAAAELVADSLADSASAVVDVIRDTELRARSAVQLLADENRSLKAHMLQSVEATAATLLQSVARLEAQSSDPSSSGQPLPVSTATLAPLFDPYIVTIDQLTSQLHHATETATALDQQLRDLRSSSVPLTVVEAERERWRLVEQELQTKSFAIDEQAVRLESSLLPLEALCRRTDGNSGQTTTRADLALRLHQRDDESGTDGLPTYQGAFSRASLQASLDAPFDAAAAEALPQPGYTTLPTVYTSPIYRSAIRELEEKAIIAASQQSSHAETAALRDENSALRQKFEVLQEEHVELRRLHTAISQDYDALRSQNDTLTAEFVSLLQATERMSVQYEAAVINRDNSGQSGTTIVGRAGLGTATTLQSLPWPTNHQAVQKSLATSRSFMETSNLPLSTPALRARGAEARQGERTHSSLEDFVTQHKRLLEEVHRLRADPRTSAAASRGDSFLSQLPQGTGLLASSPLPDAKPSKRLRDEATAPAASPRAMTTCDAGTITDACTELRSWNESALGVAVPPPPLISVSMPPIDLTAAAAHGAQVHTLLSSTLQSMHDASAQRIAELTGGPLHEAFDTLLRRLVNAEARCSTMQAELDVRTAAHRDAVEELQKRRVADDSVLQPIRQAVELLSRRAAVHSISAPNGNTAPDAAVQPAISGTHGSFSAEDLALLNSISRLLQTSCVKEQTLQDLIAHAAGRHQLALLAAVPSEAEKKLADAEGVIAELRGQLAFERKQNEQHAEALHRDKLARLATMDRLWQAEQVAVEAKEELAALLSSRGKLYTPEEYEALRQRLSETESSLVSVQLASQELERQLSDARQQCTTLTDNLSNSTQLLESNLRSLHTDLRDARASVSLLQSRNRDLEDQLQRSSVAFAASELRCESVAAEMRRAQQLTEELKASLLSMTCTEELLLHLFPNDSSLAALLERERCLTAENNELQRRLADAITACTMSSDAASRSEIQLTRAIEEKNQALAELQRVRTSELIAQASRRPGAEQAELERCRLEIHALEKSVHLYSLREKELEEKIELLSSDPVSFNVRKYGVERLRTIEEQLEQQHQKFVQLEEQLRRECETTERLTTESAARAAQIESLSAELSAVQNLLKQHKDSEAALLSQNVVTLEAKAELERTLGSVRLQEEAAKASLSEVSLALRKCQDELQAAQQANESAKAEGKLYMEDNVELVQRLRDMTELVEQLESENRAAKAALAARPVPQPREARRQGGGPSAQNSRKGAKTMKEATEWISRSAA